MKIKFNVGDRVYVKTSANHPMAFLHDPLHREGEVGTIQRVADYKNSTVNFLPDFLVMFNSGDEAWIEIQHLQPVEIKEEKVVELYPMDMAVLNHLKQVGHITNVEANAVLKCRSVSKRISSLRKAGHPIHREFKVDSQGQRYARYVMG